MYWVQKTVSTRIDQQLFFSRNYSQSPHTERPVHTNPLIPDKAIVRYGSHGYTESPYTGHFVRYRKHRPVLAVLSGMGNVETCFLYRTVYAGQTVRYRGSGVWNHRTYSQKLVSHTVWLPHQIPILDNLSAIGVMFPIPDCFLYRTTTTPDNFFVRYGRIGV